MPQEAIRQKPDIYRKIKNIYLVYLHLKHDLKRFDRCFQEKFFETVSDG